MVMYLLTGDTYVDAWGSEISCFGIYDTEEKAENALKMFSENMEIPAEMFHIEIITVNEQKETYLGGYFE